MHPGTNLLTNLIKLLFLGRPYSDRFHWLNVSDLAAGLRRQCKKRICLVFGTLKIIGDQNFVAFTRSLASTV